MAVKFETNKLTFSRFNPILKYSTPKKDGDQDVPAAVAYDIPFEIEFSSDKESIRGRIETVYVFNKPNLLSIYEYISPNGDIQLSDEELDGIFEQLQVSEERNKQLREHMEFFQNFGLGFKKAKTLPGWSG